MRRVPRHARLGLIKTQVLREVVGESDHSAASLSATNTISDSLPDPVVADSIPLPSAGNGLCQ